MSSPPKERVSIGDSGLIAFFAVIVIGYGTALWSGGLDWSSPRGALCLGFGAAYTAVVCYEARRCQEPWVLRRELVAFSIQAVLVAGILFSGRLAGSLYLMVFPLVCQAATFPAAIALAASLAVYALTAAAAHRFAPPQLVVRDSLELLAGFAFIIAFTRIGVRQREARLRAEALSAELEEANRKLSEQSARMAESARVQERNRLAREIHDSLGHYLTTVAVQIEAAQAVRDADPEGARAATEKALALARKALAEVRQSVGSLKADAGGAGLAARLQVLVDEGLGAAPVVTLEVAGAVRPLGPEIEHGLFRVVQEGLTNVRRHADASRTRIVLDYRDPGRVTVAVTDDGRGSTAGGSGHGLEGLRERIALLGGSVRAENVPEGGFRLQAEVPA